MADSKFEQDIKGGLRLGVDYDQYRAYEEIKSIFD